MYSEFSLAGWHRQTHGLIGLWLLCSRVFGVNWTVVDKCVISYFFFFSSRRRHTRFDCDWSSDVCSSDLLPIALPDAEAREALLSERKGERVRILVPERGEKARLLEMAAENARHNFEIGRASCRERVKISGVAVYLKKKIRQ